MTKLSVNINKIATLRNSRGGDLPNVVKAALDARSVSERKALRSTRDPTSGISATRT